MQLLPNPAFPSPPIEVSPSAYFLAMRGFSSCPLTVSRRQPLVVVIVTPNPFAKQKTIVGGQPGVHLGRKTLLRL